MDPHASGQAARPPRPSLVLEVPDQFFLLRIHGDDGLSRGLEPADVLVDVPELRVAVGMGGPRARLAIRRQTVPCGHEQFTVTVPVWPSRMPCARAVRA
jgi:hypothetical protein